MDQQPINVHLQTFKDTFQKPSQIYRFLRDKWLDHPLYLNRTLSYISKHRNKTVHKRDNKIDLVARRLHKSHSKQGNGVIAQLKENGNSQHVSVIEKKYASRTLENQSENLETSDSDVNLAPDADRDADSDSETVCYFQWVCNDVLRTSQKTRSSGYICPWCDRDLYFLDSLMVHLRCCHPRFTFQLVEEDDPPVIEMTINLSYDGSYCGFKYPGHDLRRDFRFTPNYPERRMPITQILFFRAKKRNNSRSFDIIKHGLTNDGDSFAYDDGEADVDVCSGRLYYHTSTCLPVKPNEVDIDSEADMDPDWLRERTQLMIDEFTDVNEGEKEILKLWNLHIMKNYKYKGDNMMPQACYDFVEREGFNILSKNLSKNFTLHLANLYDFGLISSGDLLGCIRKLNKLRPVSRTGKIKTERNSNEHCQHLSPAKRALINSHCNQ